MKSACDRGQHKQRDNHYGVSWCILCGRLFTKTCGSELNRAEWYRKAGLSL